MCKVRDSSPQGVSAHLAHRIPAHVRDFERFLACTAFERRPAKALDLARKDRQAWRIAFFAALEQHLFAHAHAKQRLGT